MKKTVQVFKSPITDRWMITDRRILWPGIVAAHDTYPEAIRHARTYKRHTRCQPGCCTGTPLCHEHEGDTNDHEH